MGCVVLSLHRFLKYKCSCYNPMHPLPVNSFHDAKCSCVPPPTRVNIFSPLSEVDDFSERDTRYSPDNKGREIGSGEDRAGSEFD